MSPLARALNDSTLATLISRSLGWIIAVYELAYALVWALSPNARSSGPSFQSLVRAGQAAGLARPMLLWTVLLGIGAAVLVGALLSRRLWPFVGALNLSWALALSYVYGSGHEAFVNPRAAFVFVPQLILVSGVHALAMGLAVRAR